MVLTDLPLWATLLLLLGLVARVTRLVTTDVITEPLRNKLHVYGVNRDYSAEKQAYVGGKASQKLAHFASKLVHCDWCSSVWVGAAAVLSAHWWADTQAWNLVALVASLSFVASWILGKEYQD